MEDRHSRTALLLGDTGVSRLASASVIIFGVGGVGGHVLEALVRAGVGRIAIVDPDEIKPSNLNRQIIATEENLYKKKVSEARVRALSINSSATIEEYDIFYSEETKEKINLSSYDYIIDAIDTVKSKILLVEEAARHNIPIISSMGTGNKLDPTAFKIADIYKTSVCPLARVMRSELRRRGIKSLKVLYSEEEPKKCEIIDTARPERHSPASVSYVPAAAGLIIAGEVILDIAYDRL